MLRQQEPRLHLRTRAPPRPQASCFPSPSPAPSRKTSVLSGLSLGCSKVGMVQHGQDSYLASVSCSYKQAWPQKNFSGT